MNQSNPFEVGRSITGRYLVSNDDGVLAKGIDTLNQAIISHLGNTTVIAPQANCSGYSSALTLERPLHPVRLKNGYISVNGTPADCVHLALNGFLDEEFDMVVSGINAGANLGDDVLYSGTVAAAIEGRFLGKPAMAISLVRGIADSDYHAAAMIAVSLIKHWDEIPLPPRSILNVNIPHLPLEEIKGLLVTRLGHRKRSQDVIRYKDPRGQKGYWLGVAGEVDEAGPGTDFHAVSEGYVSVTPVQPDMTHYQEMAHLNEWCDTLELPISR